MKRAYEMMVLVRPDLAVDDEKKGETLIKKLTGDAVTIKELTLLGKKQLAYPINKQTEAVYLLVQLEGDSLRQADIQRKAKLNDEVLRFLLTAKEQ